MTINFSEISNESDIIDDRRFSGKLLAIQAAFEVRVVCMKLLKGVTSGGPICILCNIYIYICIAICAPYISALFLSVCTKGHATLTKIPSKNYFYQRITFKISSYS